MIPKMFWKIFPPAVVATLILIMMTFAQTNLLSIITSATSEEPDEEYRVRNIARFNCSINALRSFSEFYTFLESSYSTCSNLSRFGGQVTKYGVYDGDKLVCMDEDVKPRLEGCTVLSFGIDNEWSFDDEMDKYGCRVYSFDPTMAMKSHMRSSRISFHNYGVGAYETFKLFGGYLRGKMYRYEDILLKIGELDSKIDYLKMDIEGSELGFFNEVFQDSLYLLHNIVQFGFEIHLEEIKDTQEHIPIVFHQYWKYFQLLECIGYRLAHVEANTADMNIFKYKGSLKSRCYEMLFVRRDSTRTNIFSEYS